MGFFNKLFSSDSNSNEQDPLPWQSLTELSQLKDIEQRSISKTQIIFKHSTRCGISRMVLNQFKSIYSIPESQADLYYLDLLAYRNVSDEVGYKFQVLHQSPQMLIIKNGVCVAHASHGAINDIDLNRFS